jgi:hypothetical protein
LPALGVYGLVTGSIAVLADDLTGLTGLYRLPL